MMWQWLDTYSYQNRLRFLPPLQKAMLGCIVLLFAMLGHVLVQALVFLWMGLWVVGYARIPVRLYLLFLLVPMGFFAAGMPALLIDVTLHGADSGTVHHPVLAWTVGAVQFSVSQAAIEQVVTLFARTLASLACFSFLLFTTPFTEILQLIRRLRIPVLVSELAMIMYRFIFILLKTSHQLWVAQKSRGGFQGFRASLRDAGLLASQLFVRSMNRYEMLQRGMAARGMSDEIQVQSRGSHVRSRRYEWESAIGCLVLAGIQWWMEGVRL
ncbi:cobalt ECF transporter T component CbiQ [Brevibacillus sp. TJ4]|uniref:cobalt ECF transporter T component CbiQ n=1 Tax=Brevibacillus sp. TJ4 TaxID=3234853 RepID=UPI0037D2424F